MTDGLAAFARWRADPCGFIEHVLCEPQTGEPFVLLPAERAFINQAFQLDEDGRLRFSEWLYSCPKKGGISTRRSEGWKVFRFLQDVDFCRV
jgi:hypothetical protein